MPAPYGPPPGGPPPKKGSNTTLILVLLGGGGLLVVVVVVAIVLVVAASGPPDREIATPATAGELTRDSSAESRFSSQVSEQRRDLDRALDGKLTSFETAVYRSTDYDPVTRQPERYLFIGGTADTNNDPGSFIDGFRSAAQRQSGTTVRETPPGPGGGEAACAEVRVSSERVALCAWATENSFGEVVSLTPKSGVEVAVTMREMRSDIESEV